MRESRYNIWIDRSDSAYVFNARSGALLRIPEPEHKRLRAFLDNSITARCSPELLANLVAWTNARWR
jgi:hypothetical protein